MDLSSISLSEGCFVQSCQQTNQTNHWVAWNVIITDDIILYMYTCIYIYVYCNRFWTCCETPYWSNCGWLLRGCNLPCKADTTKLYDEDVEKTYTIETQHGPIPKTHQLGLTYLLRWRVLWSFLQVLRFLPHPHIYIQAWIWIDFICWGLGGPNVVRISCSVSFNPSIYHQSNA